MCEFKGSCPHGPLVLEALGGFVVNVGQDTHSLLAILLHAPLTLAATLVKGLSCSQFPDRLDPETHSIMPCAPCPTLDTVPDRSLVLDEFWHNAKGHRKIKSRADVLDRVRYKVVVLTGGVERVLISALRVGRWNIVSRVNQHYCHKRKRSALI